MIKLSLSAIVNQLDDLTASQDTEFQGISTDTRTLKPGNLYVAIKGEQFDGHDFIEEAKNKNASAILTNHQLKTTLPQLITHDTILALGKISALWRNQFQLPIIGITGSNGKTTLKNMIASILRATCQNESLVLATEGNLNNHIGVPLMLAKLNHAHRYGVIEMGMNHFGEIDYLTHLVKPRVAIVNNAATAHLEGVKDLQGVAKAKGEIFAGLDSQGIAILNKDDAFYDYWRQLIGNHKHISFGLQHPADITATLTDSATLIHTPCGDIEVNLPLLGQHNIMNALAATAATLAIDISLDAIKKGLESVKPAPGRLHQYHLDNDVNLIDDTYNANPASVYAAIHTLASLPGIRILILGDMKELGAHAKQLHVEIGQKAYKAGIHYLFALGDLSKAAVEAFGDNAQHFSEHDELLAALQPYLKNQTTILVKGSRSMRMEKIIHELVPHSETSLHSH